MEARQGQAFVRGAAVLRRLLGLSASDALDMEDCHVANTWEEFADFVASSDLVEGMGNFGSRDNAPAHPNYVACRLTDVGKRMVRE